MVTGLTTPSHSGHRTRQTYDIFVPVLMLGVGEYKTRKAGVPTHD
jgi:hypothetical protein